MQREELRADDDGGERVALEEPTQVEPSKVRAQPGSNGASIEATAGPTTMAQVSTSIEAALTNTNSIEISRHSG